MKTIQTPDFKDLFSNIAYLAAKSAAAGKDVVSRLVFFMCAVETFYNLMLDKKINSTSYNPADICKHYKLIDNGHDIESRFTHPLDNVWDLVVKQINYRLETGSWYQLPIAPDKQFSFLYQWILGETKNDGSSKLTGAFNLGNNGQEKAKEGVQINKNSHEESAIQINVPSRANSNPQSPKTPIAISRNHRKVSLQDESGAAAKRKPQTGKRRVRNLPAPLHEESDLDALPPYLPNKTVRPSTGTTGFQVLTDANGDPMPEMYDFIRDTAIHITRALPSPSQWSTVVMYLLACLEANTENHHPMNSSLDNICRLITRRLNKGRW